MAKSPLLRAIKLTDTNILKIMYTLSGMGLILSEYNTMSHDLYLEGEHITKLEVGDWIVAHEDKTISTITQEEYDNNYLKY